MVDAPGVASAANSPLFPTPAVPLLVLIGRGTAAAAALAAAPAAGLRLPSIEAVTGVVLPCPVIDKLLLVLSLWSVMLLRTVICPVPVVELSRSSGILLGRAVGAAALLPPPIILPKAEVKVLLILIPLEVETVSDVTDVPWLPNCAEPLGPGGKDAATPPCIDPEPPNILPSRPVLPETPVLPVMPLLLGNGALGVVAAEPSELVLL